MGTVTFSNCFLLSFRESTMLSQPTCRGSHRSTPKWGPSWLTGWSRCTSSSIFCRRHSTSPSPLLTDTFRCVNYWRPTLFYMCYLAISNLKSALVTHCCVVYRSMTCQRRSYSLLVWQPCWLPVNMRKCMLQKCRILSSSLTIPTQVQRFVAWRNRCWGWWTTVWALHSAYTSWEDTHVQER